MLGKHARSVKHNSTVLFRGINSSEGHGPYILDWNVPIHINQREQMSSVKNRKRRTMDFTVDKKTRSLEAVTIIRD